MDSLIYSLAAASESVGRLLLVWSWQSLLLLGCVWLGLKCYRNSSPATRHQIWLCGLIAVAVLPIWVAMVHWFPLPKPGGEALTYVVEVPALVVAPAVAKSSEARVTAPDAGFPTPSRVWPLLMIAWVGGLLFTSVRLGVAYLKLRRARERGRRFSLSELVGDGFNCGSPSSSVAMPPEASACRRQLARPSIGRRRTRLSPIPPKPSPTRWT